jgi:hypothetical protein
MTQIADFKKAYEGIIVAPMHKRIRSFRYLFCRNEEGVEPVMAWLKTEDGVWHRFYLDAWVPYWMSLNKEAAIAYAKDGCCKNISELMNEELEAYQDEDGNEWISLNLLKTFELQNKTISNVQVSYGEQETYVFVKLLIQFKEGDEIVVNDFGDFKNAALFVNKDKVEV